MTDDKRELAKLTVTLPTDLLNSLTRMAARLRLEPSQIVECACRDLLTRQPLSPDNPSPSEKSRPSADVEMTTREGGHDTPALPPPRSSVVDFRPMGQGHYDQAPEPTSTQRLGAAQATAAPRPRFERLARAAVDFAEEQASRGSWLCDLAHQTQDEESVSRRPTLID